MASEKQKKEARERLAQYYADVLGISCREFERIIGVNPGYFKRYSCNPQRTTHALISAAFPALNMEWVDTGKGSMWNPGYEDRLCEMHPRSERKQGGIIPIEVKKPNEDMEKLIQHLIEDNNKKQATIERLMEILAQMTIKNK